MINDKINIKKKWEGGDFDSFLRNNRDKTILVKFFTLWCEPCKVLQNNIDKLLVELEQRKDPRRNNLIVLEVDAREFLELAQRSNFNVYSVPAVFLYQEGKMIKSERGSISIQKLRNFLDVA